jgi:hypothetical protein
MKPTRIAPTVAAAMAVLMTALALAPTAQADSTAVAASPQIPYSQLTAGANYSGPCPGPLVQCLTYLIGQYCGMSPTCTLVLDLGNSVIKVVVDKANNVLTVAKYLIDRTLQLVWEVLAVVIDYVDDLIDYVWPFVDRVVDLVEHVIDLVLDEVAAAEKAAQRLIQKVGDIIRPYLGYIQKEISALVWLVNQVIDEVCWVVIGGCPFVYFQKNLTGKRQYDTFDTSLTPGTVRPTAAAA